MRLNYFSRRNKALLFLVSFFCGLAPLAQAAIVDLGNVTRDSSTGLEWLDLTETVGRSYLDVSNQFDVGEEFAGWRYATESEVQVLWQNFGLTTGTTERVSILDTPKYDAFVSAVNTLGNFFPEAASIFDYGSVGVTGTLLEGFTDVYLVRGMYHNIDNDRTRISSGTDAHHETIESIYHGSYLVREVPLPAGIWLLVSAYIGLFSFRLKTSLRC